MVYQTMVYIVTVFSINTDPFELQPSGAMNLNRFKDIFYRYINNYTRKES